MSKERGLLQSVTRLRSHRVRFSGTGATSFTTMGDGDELKCNYLCIGAGTSRG